MPQTGAGQENPAPTISPIRELALARDSINYEPVQDSQDTCFPIILNLAL